MRLTFKAVAVMAVAGCGVSVASLFTTLGLVVNSRGILVVAIVVGLATMAACLIVAGQQVEEIETEEIPASSGYLLR